VRAIFSPSIKKHGLATENLVCNIHLPSPLEDAKKTNSHKHRPLKTTTSTRIIACVEMNKDNIYNLFSGKQRKFVAYVLNNYINQGVDELDIEKLSTVLSAKYGSLHSAQEKLGTVSDIQSLFVTFQEKLYMENAG